MRIRPVGEQHFPRTEPERGQTTIALAVLLVLICMIGLALMTVGDAMVHRARARTAADAVALAAASDPASAPALIEWYRNDDISIIEQGSPTSARSGPSQAVAWAERTRAAAQPAPVLVAVIARAAQLTGVEFEDIRWRATAVELPTVHADDLRLVAAELGLCEVPHRQAAIETTVFELC